MFDGIKAKNEIVAWIKEWFAENGPDCNAIVGISGGKDSSIVAALCVEALGKDRVIGCLLPNINTWDLEKDFIRNVLSTSWNPAERKNVDCNKMRSYFEKTNSILDGLGLCKILGIKHFCRSINDIVSAYYTILPFQLSQQTEINLPARIRMSILYAVAQSHNGRVANTSNYSEAFVGYCTRWGDSVGDFSPIGNYTMTEVKQIGYALGLPKELIERTPSDGLSGKSDEENLGFTYAELDSYIRGLGLNANSNVLEKIRAMHEKNSFKSKPIPKAPYKDN